MRDRLAVERRRGGSGGGAAQRCQKRKDEKPARIVGMDPQWPGCRSGGQEEIGPNQREAGGDNPPTEQNGRFHDSIVTTSARL